MFTEEAVLVYGDEETLKNDNVRRRFSLLRATCAHGLIPLKIRIPASSPLDWYDLSMALSTAAAL